MTGNSGQHHGLQYPQADMPCSPHPWYVGNECGDSRRLSGKSILHVAVSRSPKPTDWNVLRGRNAWVCRVQRNSKKCTPGGAKCGLGLLRSQELDADPAATAEQVMRAGPTTYRPNVPAGEAAERMRARRVDALLVTTPDGVLVGLLRRVDAERADADANAWGGQP
jgi:CBS domain